MPAVVSPFSSSIDCQLVDQEFANRQLRCDLFTTARNKDRLGRTTSQSEQEARAFASE